MFLTRRCGLLNIITKKLSYREGEGIRNENNRIKILITLMSAALAGGVLSAGAQEAGETADRMSEAENGRKVTITDMIGRQVEIVPGSYQHVVCIGAGALRMYSYIGDVSLLSGVEDIDNTALENRPQMFDGVARPYVIAYEDVFSKLPSCGVGGPNAQAAEAEKSLPVTRISSYLSMRTVRRKMHFRNSWVFRC